ncbi:hypothetical protein OBK24_12760 [Empedobacter falsenii]|uniref:hypothetical protein n=1 Tax=Elizabethkingia sp. JS20170427COW TaxID=2583851 RepID=UPI0011104B9F|nr:hypothetical protein [Elizabethkingia sp. JS20170427COW]QCX54387.1 hypothetical protein FGE20_11865 [Elizabethkingia sp. JS20170427COW]
MNLQEVIKSCNKYEDSDDEIYLVFARKENNKFKPNSDAQVIKISVEELETLKLDELAQKYCSGFKYFLEMSIIQDVFDDISKLEEFKDDLSKIERVIYYAKYDA